MSQLKLRYFILLAFGNEIASTITDLFLILLLFYFVAKSVRTLYSLIFEDTLYRFMPRTPLQCNILSGTLKAPAANFHFWGNSLLNWILPLEFKQQKSNYALSGRFITAFHNSRFGCFIPQTVFKFIHLIFIQLRYVFIVPINPSMTTIRMLNLVDVRG